MLLQFLLAIFFYFLFSLFVFIGLPFTARLFSNKILAYILAKPAGLLVFGYVVWLMSSFRLLDYQNWPLILSLFIASILICGGLSYKFFSSSFPTKKIIIVEVVTIFAYLAYLFARAHNSAINGTERFMDMALLTAAGKTQFFPFIDPWFAGKTVNYYYYGSYLISLISNLGRLPYALSYNFALGLLYCESALLSAALVWTITASKKMALAGAFLVTTAGTLFFAGCTIHANLIHSTQVCGYASSTRLYTPSFIINEIPSYSFTVGDLHAHLLALPFFLFNLILLYALGKLTKPGALLLTLLGLGLASSGLINTWDTITLSAIFVIIILVKIFQRISDHKHKSMGVWPALEWLIGGIAVITLVFLLMWPFLRNFQSPVMGIGFDSSFVALHHLTNVQYPTPMQAELGMWGIFALGIVWAFVRLRKQLPDFWFLMALATVAAGIILGVEVLFIKDIYSVANPPYFRANTTFKFGYHAWVLLSIIFAVALAELIKRWADHKFFYTKYLGLGLLTVALIAGLFYPFQAIKQFYWSNSLSNLTLDGADWMKQATLADWQTIDFINQNFQDRKVIAEAVGNSYTAYSRITTYTGMITPMGWQTHEWTWRLDAKAVARAKPGENVETGWGAVAKITDDIGQLYNTPNSADASQIIARYGISYVYVGDLERTAYPGLQEAKFGQLGSVVFESGSSRLYAIRVK